MRVQDRRTVQVSRKAKDRDQSGNEFPGEQPTWHKPQKLRGPEIPPSAAPTTDPFVTSGQSLPWQWAYSYSPSQNPRQIVMFSFARPCKGLQKISASAAARKGGLCCPHSAVEFSKLRR